ncbi:hypothetical protein B0H66DRAFT_235419 [Apodospora peruviana]|uniref:Secreted protein n=1 Tax=Apodospora peruviana TaxID=516989 RepID=A0AAE0M5A0_9PEZI|nr:hypothetical protein B0H66DRAFT_235419 [Apodospora peruviana]
MSCYIAFLCWCLPARLHTYTYLDTRVNIWCCQSRDPCSCRHPSSPTSLVQFHPILQVPICLCFALLSRAPELGDSRPTWYG